MPYVVAIKLAIEMTFGKHCKQKYARNIQQHLFLRRLRAAATVKATEGEGQISIVVAK